MRSSQRPQRRTSAKASRHFSSGARRSSATSAPQRLPPRSRTPPASFLASFAEDGHVGNILFALRDPALVARLVLATDQTVWRAATLGPRVDVNLRPANILLDVAPEPFGSSERPALLRRI